MQTHSKTWTWQNSMRCGITKNVRRQSAVAGPRRCRAYLTQVLKASKENQERHGGEHSRGGISDALKGPLGKLARGLKHFGKREKARDRFGRDEEAPSSDDETQEFDLALFRAFGKAMKAR